MIQIHPTLEYSCQCPVCAGALGLEQVVINGMRNLVRGACPRCGKNYYCDLPAGQGLYTPVMIDARSGEVFDPTGTRWCSDQLAESWRGRRHDAVSITAARFRAASQIVLLNCLDNLYGDALHKVFNAQRCVEQSLDCCVLIPKQLEHFVPDGVAEKWVVDLPIPRLKHWYVAIEEWVREKLWGYERCYLDPAFPQPHYLLRDLDRFLPPWGEDAAPLARPVVTFCYREDRIWGSSPRRQRRNIEELYRLLAQVFPPMTFAVSGLGRSGSFSKRIHDFRLDRFAREDEVRLFGLLRQTDVAVGVHGSNLLLPSALARATVELLPEDRYGNILQSMLVRGENPEILSNLLRYRVLYGSRNLDDVVPRRVAVVIATQLVCGDEISAVLGPDCQPVCGPQDVTAITPRVQQMFAERRQFEERLRRLK